MRLTFRLSIEEIETGVEIVGKLLKKHIRRGVKPVVNYQSLAHSI
jgi:hypothetical protein